MMSYQPITNIVYQILTGKYCMFLSIVGSVEHPLSQNTRGFNNIHNAAISKYMGQWLDHPIRQNK